MTGSRLLALGLCIIASQSCESQKKQNSRSVPTPDSAQTGDQNSSPQAPTTQDNTRDSGSSNPNSNGNTNPGTTNIPASTLTWDGKAPLSTAALQLVPVN